MKNIVHRDQIHRDVNYDPLSTALLDTRTLQRLGRVYQLGFAHLVFRGGTHTRLSHVMGVAHKADAIVDSLYLNYKLLPTNLENYQYVSPVEFLPGSGEETARWDVLKHIVRWASLLHDVGHIPLGHTLEDEFDKIYLKHDSFQSPRIPFLWWNNTRHTEIQLVLQDTSLYPRSFTDLKIDKKQVYDAVLITCLHKETIDPKTDKRTPFKKKLNEAKKKIENLINHDIDDDKEVISADEINSLGACRTNNPA